MSHYSFLIPLLSLSPLPFSLSVCLFLHVPFSSCPLGLLFNLSLPIFSPSYLLSNISPNHKSQNLPFHLKSVSHLVGL